MISFQIVTSNSSSLELLTFSMSIKAQNSPIDYPIGESTLEVEEDILLRSVLIPSKRGIDSNSAEENSMFESEKDDEILLLKEELEK
mgnify:CR=1 FL=1